MSETESMRERTSPRVRFSDRRAKGTLAIGTLLAGTAPGFAYSQERFAEAPSPAADASGWLPAPEALLWALGAAAAIAALVQAFLFYRRMMSADPGTPRMVEIAEYVRVGAGAYLRQQYLVVTGFFIVTAILLGVAAAYGAQSVYMPFAFLTGGFFSGLAGYFGMKTATQASSRTAAGAQVSLNAGLQIAFRSGAVMGLSVVGLGLLFILVWYGILRWGFDESPSRIAATMVTFGMGASLQALFARVGGGIFTKAADVGADLVGKVEAGIPEDDPRNPATIADNVGDNVGDVAGMGADLYESYCGSILAAASLGAAAFAQLGHGGDSRLQLGAIFLPVVVAAFGIVLSIVGAYLVSTKEDATQKDLLRALQKGILSATLGTSLVTFAIVWWLLPGFLGVAISVVVGLLAGWAIGQWTEYATSDEYGPTKRLAAEAQTGPATIIIGGIADGMKSVWAPVVIICIATVAAFVAATSGRYDEIESFTLGLYGIAIAAVGMLSTLGITLATDAYGPIADNAGGNAEMAHLEPYVRERTDALDSLGNTTAATGKGFAIGSAALTALALLAAYAEEIRIGFERWADDPALLAEAEPGFYKVSPHLVVEKFAEGQGSSPKDIARSWLIMPEDGRRAQWKSVPLAIDAAAAPLNVRTIGDEAVIDLAAAGAPASTLLSDPSRVALVPANRATLPDYARYYEATLLNPRTLVGLLIGCMTTFVFCAMTMKAVGRAAQQMVEEVRRQFSENPGILQGTSLPDYAAPVRISTRSAQREMILPSALSIVIPIATGLVLGVGGTMGLLAGALASGFCVAIFMANAGGSWDNAKKYVERGAFGGKGSFAHKAAVVGDTVGDPFKDTSGPSLNILIKLMSMVSLTVAALVVRYSLQAMGWF